MNKLSWKLGDEVKVEFIGVIREMAMGSDGKINYNVGDERITALRVTEDKMFELPLPKKEE